MISLGRNMLNKNNLCSVLVLTWKCSVGLSTSKDFNTSNKASLKDDIPGDHRENPSHGNSNITGKTVFDHQQRWSKCFNDSGVPEPDLSSKYIIEHVLNFKKVPSYFWVTFT